MIETQLNKGEELKEELTYLGLFDKAKEIYTELGEGSVLSYIKSSYHLLSKVYHPDLNPDNTDKSTAIQKKLNRVDQLIKEMEEEEIIDLFKSEQTGDEGQKKKILVVEDEFGLQEIFRDILVMEGYDVRVAVDGIEGLRMFEKFRPDLVFTDVVMPNMNGLDLVRKIREINPGIKVIYISGFFGIKRLKKRLDDDILKYRYLTLAKPFKVSEMLEIVNGYLNEGN